MLLLNEEKIPLSQQTQKILDMLDTMDSWLAEFPPLENPQRFGNKAFRQWLNKVEQVRVLSSSVFDGYV